MKKGVDTYTVYARVFPSIISSLPLFIIWFFLSDNVELKELGSFLINLKFYGAISLSIVFLYFFSQVIRLTSKYFENKYFVKNKGFPTTYLLTYSDNTFSKSYKDKYRKLIWDQFKLKLSDEAEEKANMIEAQKRLGESTKQVILKVGDGSLVKKHNIWYGFFRNLIGSSIYSIIFCITNLIVGFILFKNNIIIISSMILLLLYLVIFIFRKAIIIQNGEAYAKQLIAEFIHLS